MNITICVIYPHYQVIKPICQIISEKIEVSGEKLISVKIIE